MLTKEELDRYTTLFKDNEYSAFFGMVYDIAVSTLDLQTKNALDEFAKNFPANEKTSIYIALFMLDDYITKATLKYGKVVAKRIVRFSLELRSIADNTQVFKVFRNRGVVNRLFPHIDNYIKDFNFRQIHSFESYFEECNHSVLTLYFRICLSDSEMVKRPELDALNPYRVRHRSIPAVKYPGLGVKNTIEMYEKMLFIKSLIEEIVNNHDLANITNTPNVSGKGNEIVGNYDLANTMFRNRKLEALGINEDGLKSLNALVDKLGYFPLFKAISIILSSLKSRDYKIAKYCFNIYKTPQMLPMTKVAAMCGISIERVRQLKETILPYLVRNIRKIKGSDLLTGYSYDISSKYELSNISVRENVSFNENFILWVFSIINSDYRLVGDVKRAFIKYPATTEILYLVPDDLDHIFNFGKFIDSIGKKVREKRFYDERIDLDIFVRNFCSNGVKGDTFYAVVCECRKMLERGFPNIIQNSQICLKQNSRKAIPDLIEEIIRNNNNPMTAEQISNCLNALYPDLKQIPKKISHNALRNPRIVAISRTSTYTLAEWNTTEKRGGTIRELATEYLNNLMEPIAPLSDICDYIAKFRANVKETSVKANLLAEANNKFSVYYKNDAMYMGYTNYRFDSSYQRMEKRRESRSFNDSIERLEEFIKINGHFPFSSGVDAEETRLNRFFTVAKANLKKGTLSTEETAKIMRINVQYANYKTKKERVSWDDLLKRFVSYITINNKLPVPSSPEYKWYEESKDLFHEGALNTEKAQSFTIVTKIVDHMMK